MGPAPDQVFPIYCSNYFEPDPAKESFPPQLSALHSYTMKRDKWAFGHFFEDSRTNGISPDRKIP
jgi:hypothetical protein